MQTSQYKAPTDTSCPVWPCLRSRENSFSKWLHKFQKRCNIFLLAIVLHVGQSCSVVRMVTLCGQSYLLKNFSEHFTKQVSTMLNMRSNMPSTLQHGRQSRGIRGAVAPPPPPPQFCQSFEKSSFFASNFGISMPTAPHVPVIPRTFKFTPPSLCNKAKNERNACRTLVRQLDGWYNHGYTCDFLLAPATQHAQNYFLTKVESGCSCGQLPPMSAISCRKFSLRNILQYVSASHLRTCTQVQ